MASTLTPTERWTIPRSHAGRSWQSECALVVVDIQQKLLPPIFNKESLVRNSQLLIRLANILEIPVLVTTQYAKGLGDTVPEIASLLPQTTAIDKLEFSCFGKDQFCSAVKNLPGESHDDAALRHGSAHLRDADRSGRARAGIPGTCRVRRRGLSC